MLKHENDQRLYVSLLSVSKKVQVERKIKQNIPNISLLGAYR